MDCRAWFVVFAEPRNVALSSTFPARLVSVSFAPVDLHRSTGSSVHGAGWRFHVFVWLTRGRWRTRWSSEGLLVGFPELACDLLSFLSSRSKVEQIDELFLVVG